MKLALALFSALLTAHAEWSVPAEFRAAGYVKIPIENGFMLSGPGPNGAITQTISAIQYRGSLVRMRMDIRVEGPGSAQMLLRVDREGGRLGFFDNMGDRSIVAGEWRTYELTGEVAPDANTIEIGVLSSGKTDVHIRPAAFEMLPLPAVAAVRESIERNYAAVDAAYARGDLDSISALAAPDAQVTISGRTTPLRAILAQVKGQTIRSRSTVTAMRLDDGLATAWVNNESAAGVSGVLSSNRDRWIRIGGAWKLQDSTLIATRALTPPDVVAEVPRRAGMPDWTDVRIVLFEGQRTPEIPGFVTVSATLDRGAAAEKALAYLKEHAPEEAGPAALAFQSDEAGRLAAVVRAFDSHRASTPEWLLARQGAVVAYQSVTMRDRPHEAVAGQVIWLASQAYPREKLIVRVDGVSRVAPIVRNRYGRQVYTAGSVLRELLGGEYFIDIAGVPPDSPLGLWLAAQKLPFDGIVGQ